jgi:hypothetical protein
VRLEKVSSNFSATKVEGGGKRDCQQTLFFKKKIAGSNSCNYSKRGSDLLDPQVEEYSYP